MSDSQRKWEEKTLFIATVVGAIAAVLALLPVQELHPFFAFLGRAVPLWVALLVGVLAASVPGIVSKRSRGNPEPDGNAEELKKFCNLTIEGSKRVAGGGSNQYLLSGKYDQWPPGKNVWLITALVGSGRPKYWPQGEISPSKTRHEWGGRVGLGPSIGKNEEMRAILAIVGDCGRLLCEYYLDTEDSKRPGHKLPLPRLPGDVIECKEVILTKDQ
jgi:hypothetical protein